MNNSKRNSKRALFKNGDIVTNDELNTGCPLCGELLYFEQGEGLDIKISAVCCETLYVAYPKTWEILIENIDE